MSERLVWRLTVSVLKSDIRVKDKAIFEEGTGKERDSGGSGCQDLSIFFLKMTGGGAYETYLKFLCVIGNIFPES